MSENRAHHESYEKRLKRFENGSPIESISTLMNSIANFFNNEIVEAPKNKQTSLMFLGIHAIILTISEALFNKTGEEGYDYFLKKFVDGDCENLQFSIISKRLHSWRNILAHQWLGGSGHSFGYNYDMAEGWKEDGGVLYVNPQIYCDQFIKAFSSDSQLWNYESYLSTAELEDAKNRIIRKFVKK